MIKTAKTVRDLIQQLKKLDPDAAIFATLEDLATGINILREIDEIALVGISGDGIEWETYKPERQPLYAYVVFNSLLKPKQIRERAKPWTSLPEGGDTNSSPE